MIQNENRNRYTFSQSPQYFFEMPYYKNEFAFIISMIIMFLWVEGIKILSFKLKLDLWKRRKILHICTGPLFILMWPLFTSAFDASLYAATVPLIMTLRFALVGLGLMNDQQTVESATRFGNKSELLKGPLLYGIIFVLSTLFFWKEPRGVICLFILCFGDGFAEIFGKIFANTYRIPWSPSKSFAGFVGFIFSSTIFTTLFLFLFGEFIFLKPLPEYIFIRIIVVSVVSALVESLPLRDFDNVTVFVAAIATDMLITVIQ